MAKARAKAGQDRAWRSILARLENVAEDLDDALAAYDDLDALATDASWLPRLRRLMVHGEDFFVREAAMAPLIRLDGAKALPLLLKAMALGYAEGHDNDGLATYTVEAFEEHPVEGARLVRRLARSKSPKERASAAWLWDFLREHLPLEPLLALARDRSDGVRSTAVAALTSWGEDERVEAALLRAATDRSPHVRTSAASALRKRPSKAARAAFRALRNDPDASVRSYARAKFPD